MRKRKVLDINWVKIGGGILGLGLVVLLGFWDGWKVREIECLSEGNPCGKDVSEFLNQYKGRSWLTTKGVVIEKAVAKNFSVRVRVRKLWGGRFRVEIVKMDPVVALKTSGGRLWSLTTIDGEVVEVTEESKELPEVEFSWQMDFEIGQKFYDERILNAIKIVVGLDKMGKRVIGEVKESEMWVKWGENIAVFPLDRDPAALVVALQLVSLQSRIEKERAVRIDLRFKNPVVGVL